MDQLLDGEIDDSFRKSMLDHLSGCPACRAMFEGHQVVAARILAGGQVSPPQGFRQKVMQKVRSPAADPEGSSPHSVAGPVVAGMALAALIVGLAFFTTRSRPDGPTQFPGGSTPAATSTFPASPLLEIASPPSIASRSISIDRSPE